MKLIRDLDALPDRFRSGAVAIGNFDGVHRGHARIVAALVEQARRVDGPAVALTFDPHPARLLRPEQAPPPLTWTERKAELLAALGVDAMVAYPTDEALLQLSPEDFFEQIVRRRLDARALVEGPNFFFGRGRSGDIETLREFAGRTGVALEVVEPYVLDGEVVSSSRIRRAITAGDVRAAAEMLARPYRIRGTVAHGAGRGAKIGFPTANVEAIDTLLPAAGVYAGRGRARGQVWSAAISVGPNPTFGEHALKVEVHLIGCRESLYGEPLEVDFLAHLRAVRAFESVEALIEQLARDVRQAAEIAARQA
jgi:riboflavin kinase/FMN adenylyltransferase